MKAITPVHLCDKRADVSNLQKAFLNVANIQNQFSNCERGHTGLHYLVVAML